jgi:Skp family chaperone for outer membrane proteins
MQRLVLVSLAAVAVTVALVLPTGLVGQGASSAAAPARIAFINSQEILRRTPGYAVAESTYRKELQTSQTEYQKMQTQLDSAQQVFDQQSIVLSPAVRATKVKDLQAMQQRVEQRSTELQDRLRQREEDLLGPLRTRITSVIAGIRAEMNYSAIFDLDAGGFVAASDPALNITARVLQRLAQPAQ